MKQYFSPPKILENLLRLVLQDDHRDTLPGDFEEMYNRMAGETGPFRAVMWYFISILKLIPESVINFINWSTSMFKNYMTVTFRNIMKQKGYSFINISGLAIGMACSILILLWCQDEYNFDRFHENSDSLYLVPSRMLINSDWQIWGGSPPAFGPALKAEYPEIQNSARIENVPNPLVVKYKDKIFTEQVRAGDFSFLEMFTFPLVKGSLESAMSNPDVVFITEEIAEKYFLSDEPVGKVFTIENKYEFTVAGVIKTIPRNSTIRFDFLVPVEFLNRLYDNDNYTNTWYNFSFLTFVQIHKNSVVKNVNKKIEGRIITGNGDTEQAKPFLQKYSDFHLYGINGRYGSYQRVLTFAAIGFIILIIACINFMNLSTARSGTRAKEIGMRKVVGAYKKNIITQFLIESVVISLISIFIALCLTSLLIQSFNEITGKHLSMDITGNYLIIGGSLGLVLFTGLFAGSYPALFLSSFKPAHVLKGAFRFGSKGSIFRKTLVVIQFTVSVILICCTVVVFNQLELLNRKDLGINKDNIISVPVRGALKQQYFSAKRELLSDPDIVHITALQTNITWVGWDAHNWEWEGKEPSVDPMVTNLHADNDFLKAFGVGLAQGRFFNEEDVSSDLDALGKIVINETFQEIMNTESAVGRIITNGEDRYEIIGVIKDFHYEPLYKDIEPLAMYFRPDLFSLMYIKIRPDNKNEIIERIGAVMKKYNPDFPFSYRFLDEDYERLYGRVEQTGRVFKYFAFLAIFISCMGLFGMASFMAEQRTKEIGIRKILGASEPGLIFLLSKEFIKWSLLANILAWPAAWIFMNGWLQSFAFRTNIGAVTFLISGALALIIAVITVSYQAIRAARANPVDSLRYE